MERNTGLLNFGWGLILAYSLSSLGEIFAIRQLQGGGPIWGQPKDSSPDQCKEMTDIKVTILFRSLIFYKTLRSTFSPVADSDKYQEVVQYNIKHAVFFNIKTCIFHVLVRII
jgi:hypothetical protein